MSYSTIRAALDTLLSTYATGAGVPVAWENRRYNPSNDPYLAATLLPVPSAPVGLSFAACEDLSGIYQVSVYVPKGAETDELRTQVDGLLTAFARGTKQDGVLIEKAYPAPALDVGNDWHVVPVSIEYRFFG